MGSSRNLRIRRRLTVSRAFDGLPRPAGDQAHRRPRERRSRRRGVMALRILRGSRRAVRMRVGGAGVTRVVMVTGSASGIGRGMAERFAEDGDHVAIADINVEGAEKVAGELSAN